MFLLYGLTLYLYLSSLEKKIKVYIRERHCRKYDMVMFEEKYIKQYDMFKLNKESKIYGVDYIDCTLNVDVNVWHEKIDYIGLKRHEK